jgi:hypothetical protein
LVRERSRVQSSLAAPFFSKWFQLLRGRPLPSPLLFELEQSLKDVSQEAQVGKMRGLDSLSVLGSLLVAK